MKIIYFLFVVFLVGCGMYGDSIESLSKTRYTGNELNISDGVFLKNYDGVSNSEALFLYRDGVLLNCGYVSVSDLNEYRKNGMWEDFPKGRKDYGVFEIRNGEIRIEQIYPANGSEKTYIYTGLVNDNRTFTISKIINNHYGKEYNVNFEYKLLSFSPKPDSTNMFIE